MSVYCVYDQRVEGAYLRIGEVARRSGLSAELLRVWERRYGVLTPERSAGGFRLYSEDDVERVARMRRLLEDGVSPAEAARLLRADGPTPAAEQPAADEPGAREALRGAIVAFDETAAHETLDRLFAELTPEAVLREVVLPVLREVGSGWQRGEVSVAQEHFGSNLIRGRLLGLARGWARGVGPMGLLACPPGEQHDLGLIAFGVALHRLGWRVAFVGADTPYDTLASAAEAVRPTAIVLAATLQDVGPGSLEKLARRHAVFLGGAAVTPQMAAAAGARHLAEDPVASAATVAASARA